MRWWPREPFNSGSHLLGVLLSIVALVVLVMDAHGQAGRVCGLTIYGVSLIGLYAASTMHHWLHLSPRGRDVMRRIDHVAIFVLIAGSYTPVCLVILDGAWGWSLLAAVWGVALAGMVVKFGFRHLPKWVSTGLYVAMGWMAVVAIRPLAHAVPPAALMWLLAGGLAYTAGAVIYALERPDPFPAVFGHHEIFHVFVLAGSALHFVFMARYVA